MSYVLSKLIPNDGKPSYVSEVAFSPDGRIFAATFGLKHEVRLYDARTLELLRVLGGAAARLDRPHGICITSRHLIVSDKGSVPSVLLVYRLDDASCEPVHAYTTPFAHLVEAHSIALDGRRLVISYCERKDKKGALVSYDYDDETGRINGQVDIVEGWFRRHGDAKGVSFDRSGDRVFVTFESAIVRRPRKVLTERIKNLLSLGHAGNTRCNGIAAFGIDQRGRITRRPLWTRMFSEDCRLENIHICGDQAAVTDPLTGRVFLYDLARADPFDTPLQVLSDELVFPHGVKFSPDRRRLVVTDFGIDVVDGEIQWDRFVSPRSDRIVVFEQ